ncbi:MAG: hypothetical protein ACJ8EL_06790 [Rhizomicrobium sp.]|jgi:hypothetical protein
MGKYDGLGAYLRAQAREHVPMTFAEIERVVGTKLPVSQRYQAWWSNNTSNNVMTRIWLDAGYRTEQVDTAAKKLVFRRISKSQSSRDVNMTSLEPEAGQSPGGKPRRSPLFGALKGTFTLAPDHDPTSPMFTGEEWAEIEKEMDEDWDQIEQGMASSKK